MPAKIKNLIKNSISLLFLASFFLCFQLKAWDFNPFSGAHCFTIGPELDYMKRTRGSGSTMDGFLYGGWASYDRIRPMSWYYGAEGYWITGTISGEFRKHHTCATNRDGDIMGKLGFTFQTCWRKFTFIPYVGYGYFDGLTTFRTERNEDDEGEKRHKHVVFNDTFQYYALGFMTWAWVTNSIAVGVDFKWKYMNDGQQRINEDPQFGKVKLSMNDKSHYEVDIPVTYKTCVIGKQIFASVVPFCRFRSYGERENYPFNFAKTDYQIYGARLLATICF